MSIRFILFKIRYFIGKVIYIRKSKVNVACFVKHPIHKLILFSGVAALYNGLGPTVVRTFPATGALFLAYEGTKKVLHNLMD